MKNLLVRLIGWKATILHGDPTVFDRWKLLKRYLLTGPIRTLDVVCGSGAFTMYASKIGNESVGITFDERNSSIVSIRANILGLQNIKIIQKDLRYLDKYIDKLGKFDQIICFESIEHILDDRKLISELSLLLKPGGRLLLTTPFKHYKPLRGDRLSDYEDGGHVRWGYTHEEIRELFDTCGIDVILNEYVSGIISQQLTNFMRILSKINSLFAWAIIFPLRIFQIFDPSLTKLIDYPYMCIGVVGKKRE